MAPAHPGGGPDGDVGAPDQQNSMRPARDSPAAQFHQGSPARRGGAAIPAGSANSLPNRGGVPLVWGK